MKRTQIKQIFQKLFGVKIRIVRRKRRKGLKSEYIKYKAQALEIAQRKIAQFNLVYNFKYNKITIRNQSTKWGSCSKSGNINFNYKIALLPENLADYIIVHELCHLGEFNHSKDFWDLVEKIIPDYKLRKSHLKKISSNGINIT